MIAVKKMDQHKNSSPHQTRREVIYHDLKRQILSGSLLPGSRLVESTLANQWKISRTVIREVIKQLELEGLVKIIPYKGAEVSRFSLEDIEEIYELQATLEGMAASSATKKMLPGELKKLKQIQKKLQKALNKDAEQWQKLNVDFHQFFINRCGNRRLQGLIKNQRDYFARYWRLILSIPGQRERNMAGHERILKAAENGNPLQVRLAMEEHIHQAAQNLKEFLAANSFLL